MGFRKADFLKSGVEGLETLQGPEKESGCLQQDQGDSDLGDDRRLAENSCATAEGALALMQC
jgi:hypothetical protein